MPSYSAPNIGTVVKLGWDSANPITKQYGFTAPITLQKHQSFIDAGGIRGTLAQQSENRAAGIIPVNGGVPFPASYNLLANVLLQAVMGGAPTGTSPKTYPFANGNYDTYMTLDRGTLGVDTYGLCWVNRATFTSEQNGPLEIELEMLGQTETNGAAGSFPAAPTIYYDPPFTHIGAAFTALTIARQIERVQWVIDNHYTEDRYFNSQTLATPAKQEVTCQVTIRIPASASADVNDLLTLVTAGTSSGVSTWSDGTHTLTFTAGNLQLSTTPVKQIAGKTENKLDITFDVMRLSTTEFLSITM